MAGRRLTICGIVQDDRYFTAMVAPHIDGDRVIFLAAFLHPIDFHEPFGLSVVESLVCGTPVVAYERGSMPEIIDKGVTGFLVRGIDQSPRTAASAHRGAGPPAARHRRSVRSAGASPAERRQPEGTQMTTS